MNSSMQFRLLAIQEVVEEAKAGKSSSAVYGYVRENEGLIQVLSAVPKVGMTRIGNLRKGIGSGVPVLIDEETPYRLQLARGIPEPTDSYFIPVRECMDCRRSGIISDLSSKTVAFFGAGSLGSVIALAVAESGVGHIKVIDNDRLDASNISRHVCARDDIGRGKAVGLCDHIDRRMVQTTPLTADITELSSDCLQELLADVDVAVATTDSLHAQLVVNDACVSSATPLVAAGAYERAAAGEVILVQPGSFCYYCAVGFRSEIAPDLSLSERREAYQDGSPQLAAEPGLAVDINYLASVAASYVLATLDPKGSRASLTDPAKGFVLLHGGSKPAGTQAQLFQAPFDLIYAQPVREEPCPVCSWQSVEAVSI